MYQPSLLLPCMIFLWLFYYSGFLCIYLSEQILPLIGVIIWWYKALLDIHWNIHGKAIVMLTVE